MSAALPLDPWPRLQAIVDVDVAAHAGWAPLDLATALLDGGARLLQLRAKTLDAASCLALADALVSRAAGYDAAVIVNDRVDLARLSGAAGAHVGQDDLDAAAARAILGPDAVLGLSTHTPDQIALASRAPVTYIAVGPIFGTTTKDTGYTAVGLSLVSAARETGKPVVAIGGITLDRAPAVIEAGAAMVAVIGDLLVGGDPAARVRAYAAALGRA